MHKVHYSASSVDSTLNFELQISNKNGETEIVSELFSIDLKREKLNEIYSILKERADNKKYKDLSTEEAKNLCFTLQEMIKKKTTDMSLAKINTQDVQGLYIGLSFLRRIVAQKVIISGSSRNDRASLRKLMSVSPVDPNPNPNPGLQKQIALLSDQTVCEGYLRGQSPFVLNEDIIVNVQSFLNTISQDLAGGQNSDQGLYVFQEVLKNELNSSISYMELLVKIDSYRLQHPELNEDNPGDINSYSWWPSGGTHGCCGNYNGPCWYWHPWCYVHDKICANCNPRWFCFDGCKPDPVRNDFYDVKPVEVIEDVRLDTTHLHPIN